MRAAPTLTSQGSYDDMVKAVARGEFDCAVADVSITSARESIVAFSTPYFVDPVKLAVRLPLVNAAGLFSFLSPFEGSLWVTYLALAVSCGVLLFFFERGHNEELTLVSRVRGKQGKEATKRCMSVGKNST